MENRMTDHPDTALIVAGIVHQVWRSAPAADIAKVHAGSGELVEFRDPTLVCGMHWDGSKLSPPPVTPASLAELQARRIAEAWAFCQQRLAGDAITVKTSAGELPFGIDDTTRSNLQHAVIGIEIMPAGTAPNPKLWAPKGLTPLPLSHDDLRAAAIATNAAHEALMQAYLQHKAAIKALAGAEAAKAYDLASGWPPQNAHYAVDVSGAPARIAALQATQQSIVDAMKDLATPMPNLSGPGPVPPAGGL
jgi:hypothetical protein